MARIEGVIRWAVMLGLLATPLAAAECRDLSFDGAIFTTCRVDLQTERVELFHSGPDGVLFGTFQSLDRSLGKLGYRLDVAMNAGMYHRNRAPVGLHIEDGVEIMRVITSDGPGNFGLLPNGVLCLNKTQALIIETRSYADERPGCEDATQSGPMLVIDGTLHPRFLPESDSLYVRNGVGIDEDGQTLWMAISNEPVNFHHFGRLFRDALMTPNALYMDGNISRLYAPGLDRHDAGFPMGPILGVIEAK